jgi:hypothetical protein
VWVLKVLDFLEGVLRVGFVMLPIGLISLIYPDMTKRNKTLDIGEDEIPMYDFLAPETRHPNYHRWLTAYICCYFGLYFAFFYKCQPDAGVGEFIIGLFLSAFFVGDFLLGFFGLAEWGSGSASSCFQ